jgi:uncharacterized protein (TIGR02145 family)
MRKTNIILVLIMLSLVGFGQDIIIDFAGQGASTQVTTVEVVNLSNCTSIEVPGGSSLNLTTGVGVEEFKNLKSNSITSYPNPFDNSTNIEFYVSQKDYVTLSICDIAGKVVANYDSEMTAGVHSFEFTANNSGMYFINVSGTNFVQSSKVICLSNNYQQAQLIYNEQVAGATTEKSYKNSNSKEFSFTVGDMLKLKGISGDYATVMVVEPTISATYTFNFVSCQDADGNNYAVVEIGTQTWMAENIKTTSYVGGDAIPLVTDNTAWGALEDNDTDKAYCFYDNDDANADIYGALYTYAAATNGDNSESGVQGVCPTGWHLSSDAEWTVLTNELGGESVSGGKLKSTCMELWYTPNIGATNESGFTALPGGSRYYGSGTFSNQSNDGYFWLATEDSDTKAWGWYLYSDFSNGNRYYFYKSYGFSVRCLLD